MGKEKRSRVKLTMPEIKKALGFEPFKDEQTGEWVVPYAKFAHFKTKVLDAVKDDLDRMARENHTDITFDYQPVYLNGRQRGDPDYIEFTIVSTDLGIGYSLLTKKDTPATGEAKERKREAVQQELFADEVKPQVQDFVAGEGSGLWARLLDGYDGPARPLLLRAEYLGLRDGAFLVRVSDEDDKAWRSIDDSDLQQTGRQLLGLPSFMPSVRRMK